MPATPTAKARAYPRVCGATLRQHLLLEQIYGLSPRVRGNPCPEGQEPSKYGPIPACAGQPAMGVDTLLTLTAYPRVCGATPPKRCVRWRITGLSPRVRGNRSYALFISG